MPRARKALHRYIYQERHCDTPSFTVTFNPNGGTGDISPLTVSKGNTTDNPTLPTRTFGGWYTDEALTLPFFFATETITQPITLYAGWNEHNHYTVRFNPNGGAAIPPSKSNKP